ncbi:MAG: zinc ribbon domain-containing protein [Blastocatellia bacterium]|nr:zinc ribbon domain-containing protein [Blastocatellia bacterium]
MYCSSCGTVLSKQMKYCNRCGARLIATKEATGIEAQEKRLDEYLTGLFWVTVFGLGLILGGMALMTEVLHLGRGVIIGYLILSSLAFIINFGLNLWETLRIIKSLREAKGAGEVASFDTNELGPVKPAVALESAPSVTENTTRKLETISKEQII